MKWLLILIFSSQLVLASDFGATAINANQMQKREQARIKSPLRFEIMPSMKESIRKTIDVTDGAQPGAPANPKANIQNNPYNIKGPKGRLYREGTGTRGGGSGISETIGQQSVVKLLDVYRSENQAQHPTFFAIDATLLQISNSHSPEVATELIYQLIIARINKQLPPLGKYIESAATNLPFHKWVGTTSEIPVIQDYLEDIQLGSDQKHIQIAYRRNNQIIYNKDYYQAMNGLNRAALRLHEYIYASSSLKQSSQVQRLVSLVLSQQFTEPNFSGSVKNILNDVYLYGLMTTGLELTNHAKVTTEKPSWPDFCGTIESIQHLPEQKKLKIVIAVDERNQHLSQADFKIERGLNFNKRADLQLDERQAQIFLFNWYQAKKLLALKYPLYIYPAQSVTADILCANSITAKINSFEIGLSFGESKNASELKSSQLEANYVQAQETWVQNPTPDSGADLERAELKLQMDALVQGSDLPDLLKGKILGNMRVKISLP